MSEESHNQGTHQSVLVKKPTKGMTNSCTCTLGVRCVVEDMNILSWKALREPSEHQVIPLF